jgi:nitrogen regulatory protein P-II 1
MEGIGQHGVTVSTVEGRGSRQAWTHHVRGATFNDTVRERSRVEVVVRDEDAVVTIDAIQAAAVTGRAGDGNIFVHDLSDVIRIRTGEKGEIAI